MNIERLTRLADLLEGVGPYEAVGPVPASRFDMATWIVNSRIDGDSVLSQIVQADRLEGVCNTSGCAVGWALADPWFRVQGLRPMEHRWANRYLTPTFVDPEIGEEELREFAAVARFFDLSMDTTEYLFSPDFYRDEDDESWDESSTTPQQVADRIREVIHNSFKETYDGWPEGNDR